MATCPRDCGTCPAWKKSVFSELAPAVLDRIAAGKRPVELAKGGKLFEQGTPYDGIFCVARGSVKISQRDRNKKEAIVRIAAPGDIVGHRSIFGGTHYRGTATALEVVSACAIPSSLVQELLTSEASLQIRLMSKLVKDIEVAERRLAGFALKSARERVAETLLILQEGAVELTRAEISSLVGAAEETVIRIISELREAGLVGQDGRRLIVLDPEKLRRISESGS